MRRKRSVFRPHGPVIGVFLGLPGANVDHWLDRDHHAGPKHEAGVRLAEVWNLRLFVHLATDAVAHIFLDDREAFALDPCLDGVTNIADTSSTARRANAAPDRLLADADQALFVRAHITDANGHGRIGDEPLVRASKVYADDVSIQHLSVAGDTVEDLILDRKADGRRVAVVAEEGRDQGALLVLAPHDLVQLQLDDAGPQRVDQDLEHLSEMAASLPHDADLVARLHDNGHLSSRLRAGASGLQ